MGLNMTYEDKLNDIQVNPNNHHHSHDQLIACCTMEDGSLNLALMEAHSHFAPVGMNGGQRCDSTSGPCSCGAWH
jgi:hypothetical protein